MASLAIDVDRQDVSSRAVEAIQTSADRLAVMPARTAGRSRLVMLAVCAGALGCVGALAGAGYLVLSGPSFLAGFAFSPGPGTPKREAIRMGRVPDMPEIRNGVPELVARPPIRVIQAAASPAATSLPEPESLRGPAVAPASRDASLQAEPVSTASLPATGLVTAASARTSATLLSEAPSVPVPAALVPRPAEATPLSGRGAVPLPPPAPRMPLAKVAAAPSGRPERTASAGAVIPAPQKVTRTQVADARPVAPESDDDHVNVFGLEVPTIGSTGRKLRDAVGALGDAFVSLPGKF